MLNKVFLIGHLGRDPELRYTQSGMPIATLNIATDESYTDKEGNKIDKVEWHRVVVFQRQAENCANFLGKGSLVFVEGSLQTRKWQDPQGQERYTTEIKAQRVQFLNRKGEGRADDSGYDSYGQMSRGDQRPPQKYGARDTGDYAPYPDSPGRMRGGDAEPHGRPGKSQDEPMDGAFPSEGGGMDEVPF